MVNKSQNDDLKISDDLVGEAKRTPQLHHHYNVMLLDLSNKLSKLVIKHKKVYKEKWEYYMGKADSSIYVENPLPLRIIKTDVHHYLDTDENLSLLTEEIELLKNQIKFIEETIKQINQRTFHIKNSIDYLKFINGET